MRAEERRPGLDSERIENSIARSMRGAVPSAYLVLLALLPLGFAVAEDGGNTPGFHDDVACVDDASFTYDLFLPKRYAEEPERRFPAYFLTSPVGNPNIKPFCAWADQRGFILLAINNSRNGVNVHRPQDLLLHSIEERGLRLHHCLRYAGGLSGGAAASADLVMRYPHQFAGLHMSAHSGIGILAPPYMAITIYSGRRDGTHPFEIQQGVAEEYRSQGNPLWFLPHDGGHDNVPDDQMVAFLDWMYWRTLLSHPALTPEDLRTNMQILELEVAAIADVADAASRAERCGVLLATPRITASPEGGELIDMWIVAVQERAAASADTVGRFWHLQAASEEPWFTAVDATIRRAIGKELRELQRDDAVKAENIAYGAYRKVQEMERRANTLALTEQVATAYGQIAERFPDTRYGRMAANR
jgi:predicted esterase